MSRSNSKRQRTGTALIFGAPSDADLPSSQRDNPSASAASTRVLPVRKVPALTTLCARVFVANIRQLVGVAWDSQTPFLKILPDPLIPKVFAMLRASCPTLLNHAFIATYFLKGSSITLTSSLPGVNKSTISAISTIGADLRELELSGFQKFPDTLFASLLSHLPSLRVLNLRGCTKVGPKTISAAAKSCPDLTVVNLNYTSVTPVSLVPLLTALHHLEVLKLAGIPNWTDATFSKLSAALNDDFMMPSLRTLKLRQLSLSDSSISLLVARSPHLQRLDLAFTAVRRPIYLIATPSLSLEKLSLTSTAVWAVDFLEIIKLSPSLKTLALGALGGGQGTSAAIGNSSAMTMTDGTLAALTEILDKHVHLEDISLVGNTKLGTISKGNGALFDFVRKVGRKCKRLNLARIPSLRSSDLAGLIPEDGVYSPLEDLVLSNTGVDDDASPYIACCPSLQSLDVAGTKLTNDGIFPIIDACTNLVSIDATGCRGIPVADRRQLFEVWEKEKQR